MSSPASLKHIGLTEGSGLFVPPIIYYQSYLAGALDSAVRVSPPQVVTPVPLHSQRGKQLLQTCKPMAMPGVWMGQKERNHWLPFHSEEGGGRQAKLGKQIPSNSNFTCSLPRRRTSNHLLRMKSWENIKKGTQEVNDADSK